MIYKEGSGINQKIGAAAVSPNRTPRCFLGAITNYTVYSAELYGIILAAILACIPNHGKRKLVICIDNQAAIRAVINPDKSSGQHLVKLIVKFINRLRSIGIETELHWVPAHIGIAGNEMADTAAKQATGWRQKKNKRGKIKEYDPKHTAKPAKLAHLFKNPLKTVLAKIAKTQWDTYWQEEETGRELYALQSTPKRAVLKLHQGLTKELSSLAIQMRTGKIGLRQFLYRRRIPGIETERCQCGQGPQTISHVLFVCRSFVELRYGYWKEEMKRAMWGEVSLKTVLTLTLTV